MRAIVYVDGFNLYYGLRQYERLGRLYKWLDLGALCRLELPNDTVTQIRYFTARIQSRPGNPQQAQRQQAYLRALATIPGLSIHYGSFQQNPVWLPLAASPPNQPQMARVLRTEEKGSDVNLATYLLCDGFAGAYDLAVVISNDSDLCLPIEVVRKQLKRQVGILSPNQRFGSALRRVATFFRPIQESSLAASQFPAVVTDSRGRAISKPLTW